MTRPASYIRQNVNKRCDSCRHCVSCPESGLLFCLFGEAHPIAGINDNTTPEELANMIRPLVVDKTGVCNEWEAQS